MAMMFKGYFLEASRVFPECLKGVWRKFQENFHGVLKKFHVACHSSQLPDQKEGLFYMQYYILSYTISYIVIYSNIKDHILLYLMQHITISRQCYHSSNFLDQVRE